VHPRRAAAPTRPILVALAVLGAVLASLAVSVAPAAAAGVGVTHTVGAGDSLIGIAQRYGIGFAELLSANRLSAGSTIHPGERLLVPGVVLPTRLPPRLPADLRATPARLRLLPTFQAEAARYRVPADLLMAVAYTESAWRASIVSPVGAIGIGQLLPATASWVARDLLRSPGLDPRDPQDNIRLSARYLRWLLDRYPSERLALAAYFEGEGNVTVTGPSRWAQRYARIVQDRRPLFRF